LGNKKNVAVNLKPPQSAGQSQGGQGKGQGPSKSQGQGQKAIKGAGYKAGKGDSEEKRLFDRIFGRIPKYTLTAVIKLIIFIYSINLPLNSRVQFLHTKTIGWNLDELIADLLILATVPKKSGKNGYAEYKRRFHIECETKKNIIMPLRMHNYGHENAVSTGDSSISPEPLVIYLDKNSTITNQLSMTYGIEPNITLTYSIKVLRFMDFTPRDLLDNDLILLAHLLLLKYRSEVDSLSQNLTLRANADDLKKKILYLDVIEECCKIGKIDRLRDGIYLAHFTFELYKYICMLNIRH
jgi:hypothetical protein